eukprot:jgi/Galph1/3884/GphlegSOOS_G2553.1
MGKKQKEKKVVSLAEFNASMGLDPLKPYELQSLPTAPKGGPLENQKDFSRMRREGFRGTRRDIGEQQQEMEGDQKRNSLRGMEEEGRREIDWSMARQGKSIEKPSETAERHQLVRDVDFSGVRSGSLVIGEDSVNSLHRPNARQSREQKETFENFRRETSVEETESEKKDFSNVRRGKVISLAEERDNGRDKDVDFSKARSGRNVIEDSVNQTKDKTKETREVDFGDLRRDGQTDVSGFRSQRKEEDKIDLSKLRSGSQVISSVPGNRRREVDFSKVRNEDKGNVEESADSEGKPSRRFPRRMRLSNDSPSKELDFSKLRVRE